MARRVIFFFYGENESIFSFTPAYTFSQKRGTAHIIIGRISLMVF
jgi:hypothetical protein